jgi:hypothetical protein
MSDSSAFEIDIADEFERLRHAATMEAVIYEERS